MVDCDGLAAHQGCACVGSACCENGAAEPDGVGTVVTAAFVDGVTSGCVAANHPVVEVFSHEKVFAVVDGDVDTCAGC